MASILKLFNRKFHRSFQEFFELEASGGIILLLCTLIALVWANSPWSASYTSLWQTQLTLGLGNFVLSKPLILWINDGLMAIFFFLIGMEIKREILMGELASLKQALLPVVAALGGMIVPALIYLSLNQGTPGAAGWGIPMGTDIAFALGVLALLGNRIPLSLKIFLAALAIVDDIGAVLVIAFFYTSEFSWLYLGLGFVIFLLLLAANRLNVRHLSVYLILGVILWLAFLKSGVHATIAGVLLAITIPARAHINPNQFLAKSRSLLDDFESGGESGEWVPMNEDREDSLTALRRAAVQVEIPLQRLERILHPWVSYFIMPLFALANAGVALSFSDLSKALSHPVSLGIFFGLVFGKQLGITSFVWLAVRTGIAELPTGVTFRHIYGLSWIAGIGFTMSLFIAGLAFEGTELLTFAKVGILMASLVAGTVGYLILRTSPLISDT